MDKKRLRAKAREVYKVLSRADAYQYNRSICEQLQELLSTQLYQTIGVYMPLKDEPDLCPLYKVLESEGKVMYLPRVVSEECIEFYRYQVGDSLEVSNHFKIEEPKGGEVLRKSVDILIIPALHYYGHYRLGRGKGYYDRYLSQCRPKLAIGVTYGLLGEESFEVNGWDQPVDIVLKPIVHE